MASKGIRAGEAWDQQAQHDAGQGWSTADVAVSKLLGARAWENHCVRTRFMLLAPASLCALTQLRRTSHLSSHM